MNNCSKRLVVFVLGIIFIIGFWNSIIAGSPKKLGMLSPTAVNDSASTCMGNSVNINILINDIVNNPALSLDTASVDLGPGSGHSLTVSGGTFTLDISTGLVLFTPNPGFIGSATAKYTVKDNLGNVSNLATITVKVNPIPNSYNVTGGGNYCQGTFAGVGVGLSGSDIGVNYQLLINGVLSGSIISGTGNPLSFGSQTTIGIYRIQATNPTTGCIVIMNSSASVNSVPPPTIYTVGGGGIGCSTGSGAVVTLSGSDLNVNYQLQNGPTLVGTPIPGTGSAISFAPVFSNSGNYTVTATNAFTSCTSLMSGSAVVTIYSAPTLFTVSGVNLCEGNLANDIKLSGSQVGVSYQILLNGASFGNPIIGTGAPIHFIGDTIPGTYRIIATNPSGCFSTMRNSAVVSPSPSVYTLSPKNQNYCPSGTMPSITLSNSDLGVNYQLVSSGANYGPALPGTGSSLIFGPLPAGKYWVVATNAGSGCSALPTDTVQITANPIPSAFTLNPIIGHYCQGSQGAQLVLSGSQTGINYQLYYKGNAVGPVVNGTGNPLSFGYFPAGTYTVSAISASNPCSAVISDTSTIILDSLPQTFSLSPDTGHYCLGGSGVMVKLSGSQVGVSYQFLKNGIPQGTGFFGTGSALSFGLQTSGTYSVIAINNTTGCALAMPNNAVIIADSLPVSFTINPKNSSYCSGSNGVSLVLSGSKTGINYQIMSGNNPLGTPIPGTGSALNLGVFPQGSYSVLAVNTQSGCFISSTDTAIITKDSLPLLFVLSPTSSHYCKGDSGFHLSLNGSETGIQYQLLSGGKPIGTPLSGTGNPLDFGLYKAGIYSVLETNPSTTCSQTTNTATLIVDSTLKKFLLNPLNPHYCTGNGVDLKLSGSETGVNYQLYSGTTAIGSLISGTGSSIDFGIQPYGVYFVQGIPVSGTCNGIVSDTTTVTKDSIPKNFNLSGNHEYCPGTGGTNLTLSGSELGVSYQVMDLSGAMGLPQNGTGSPLIFNTLPTGNYTVTASTPGGCTAIMNQGVPFTVKPVLSGIITSHHAICSNPNSGSLHLTIQGGTGPYTVLWNNNKTDTVITGLSIGTYSATVKDSSGCSIVVSGIVSNSNPPVTKPVTLTTTYNTPISFSLISSITVTDTSLNLKTIDLDPSTAGIQTSVSVAGGQFHVDSVGKVTFTPTNLFTGTAIIFYTISDNNGCLSDTSKIQVTVQPNSNPNDPLKFPTLFTPNGDGYNDDFEIEGLKSYPNNTLEVFNRWGNQVFFAQGYLTQVGAWDGNGLGEGTYYYILKVEIGGVQKKYSGYIVIIRSAK